MPHLYSTLLVVVPQGFPVALLLEIVVSKLVKEVPYLLRVSLTLHFCLFNSIILRLTTYTFSFSSIISGSLSIVNCGGLGDGLE